MNKAFAIAVAMAAGLSAPAFRTTAASPVQVTTRGGSHPTVPPDGRWVAYTVVPGGGIARVPASGGPAVKLSNFGWFPDWAPGGSLIAFTDGGVLYTVDAGGGAPPVLVASGDFDGGPDWAPAGDEIALQGRTSITVVAYPSGVMSSIPCRDPDGSACDGEGPAWSPTGREIAFEDGLEILKVPRSGGVAEVVVEGFPDVAQPDWSPDGRWIAFAMDEPDYSGASIWVADARGAAFGLVRVTSGPFLDLSPAWAPDGATIFFESDRSGRREIWRAPFSAPPTPARAATWGEIKARYR